MCCPSNPRDLCGFYQVVEGPFYHVFLDLFETLAFAVGFYSYRFELKNLTVVTQLKV